MGILLCHHHKEVRYKLKWLFSVNYIRYDVMTPLISCGVQTVVDIIDNWDYLSTGNYS